MSMKLLAKSDVAKAKAIEREMEVKEGLKLARRVDNLREVAVQEDASLQKFRRETVTTIHEEITKEARKRDVLKQEVATLEERKAKALEPLTAEKRALKQEWAELDTEREKIARANDRLADKERDIETKVKKTDALLNRTEIQNADANTRLQNVARAEEGTKLALEKATRIRQEASEYRAKVNTELTHRDSMASSRERGVTIRENNLAVKETELLDGWTLLRDRIATFERELKRVKK